MIRNVLVTSGGTSEPIDSIRSITNKSTGKLGSLIAEGFSARESVEKVYYLHGKGAILPSSDKMIPIEIETVSELLSVVKELFKNTSIDAVVHAMAVSDYRVRSVSSAEDVLPLAQRASGVSEFKAALAGADLRDEGTKISSDLESPVLLLERTRMYYDKCVAF